MAFTTSDTIYITQDGDMLDLICWKHYGTSHLTTEMVLARNYNLSSYPPVLSRGMQILLPAYEAPKPAASLNIWD